MHSTRAAWGVGKTGMVIGLTMLTLAGCSRRGTVAVMEPPPPAPVGHIYPTMVEMPVISSHRIKMSRAQVETYQQAFNVIGLKSALMVGALTCDQRRQYDVFMTTFQPHILAEQHVMDGYFRRVGGRAGQNREDDFVTLLANNQSVNAQAQGSVFCLNTSAEFNAVLALRTPQELDNFASNMTAKAPTTVASAGEP